MNGKNLVIAYFPIQEAFGGSGLSLVVDASLIEADANKQFSASKEEWDVERIDVEAAPRAVKDYLNTLDEAAFGAATRV